MQLDTCGLIGLCMQQFSQLSWFCSSTCRQFHWSVFGMVLQRFCTWFERCCNLCCTKVWRWSNDVAVKGLKKDGIAIWNTPAAEDHNMFVCCMFLELGVFGVVLSLNLTWTLLELFLSWSFWSKFLSTSVPLCARVYHVAFWFARHGSSGPAVWSSLDGLAVQPLPWVSFWKRKRSAQLPGLADNTKGSEDNTSKKLLEPEVQKPNVPSDWKPVTNV